VKLVAVDIGGTHARLALAEVEQGRVVSLGEAVTLKTAEHASFQTAWQEFARLIGAPLPRAAAIAVAGPVSGEVIKFTNNPWILRPALIGEKLGVDRYVLINDFAAVGHAAAQAGPEHFIHLTGPDEPLPAAGTISIVGPGTGLGVAHVLRWQGGYHVQPTEGGHIDFAPLDSVEDAILARLRQRHRRVSVERVVAGPGIVDIYETLAGIEGRAVHAQGDKAIWALPPPTGSACRWAALPAISRWRRAGRHWCWQAGWACGSRISCFAPGSRPGFAPRAASRR